MTTFDERKAKIRALDPDEARRLLGGSNVI